MKRIVVGYDETEGSKRALERAAQLAKAFDATLIVTSVAPIIASIGRSAGPIDPTDPPEEHLEELRHARAYLEGEGITADYQPAVGNVGDAIMQLANEQHADLIVVGTREMGFLERLLHHSVSSEVAHRAHCDVLIVHAHQ